MPLLQLLLLPPLPAPLWPHTHADNAFMYNSDPSHPVCCSARALRALWDVKYAAIDELWTLSLAKVRVCVCVR